jgi:hypothetical protein
VPWPDLVADGEHDRRRRVVRRRAGRPRQRPPGPNGLVMHAPGCCSPPGAGRRMGRHQGVCVGPLAGALRADPQPTAERVVDFWCSAPGPDEGPVSATSSSRTGRDDSWGRHVWAVGHCYGRSPWRPGSGQQALHEKAGRCWSPWSTCPTSAPRRTRLLDRDTDDVLARAAYDGRPGHPVLLGRDHWAGVLAVSGRGRGPGTTWPRTADEVECGDLATGRDVTTRPNRRPTPR